MNDINDDIIDNNELEKIAGKISTIQSLKKDFKPWHKPRKQWIRSCQWRNSLKSLLDENSYSDVSTVKYFSFPGEDCLDIKILYEQCKQKDKILYFQGIESDPIRSQAVISQIMDLDGIDSTSSLHAESCFEEISTEKSSLFEKITSGLPYNVINFDFTNSIFSPRKGSETMQAICKIIDRQLNQQYLKWQLYITTRCNIDSINTECLKDYITKLLDNCKNSEEFLTLVKQNICSTMQIDSTENYLIENSQNFEKLVIISFIKWLIALSVNKNVKMSLQSSAEYTVNIDSTDPDMISLVFEFKKSDRPTDPTEITYSSNVINEKEIAYDACNKFLEKTKNVDTLLEDEPDTRIKLTQEIKMMLSNIGYDTSCYPY